MIIIKKNKSNMIATPSNFLSLLRGFLAFLFLSQSLFWRSFAIILAMLTDCLDGYLARRLKMTSSLGATLDPLMDKFFVFFIVSIFMIEGQLQMWQALAFIARDFAVFLFGLYIALKGTWAHFQFRSIWAGKISTTLQFFVLLALTFHFSIPSAVFYGFIVLGFLALVELYFIERQISKSKTHV
jgi:CDP-diacylglycerol--glycerol-3-phosphate 3-phosphatidyltransferase